MQRRLTYEQRLVIPMNGDKQTCLYTKSGLLIANGYERVVIGQRGPYVELTTSQIVLENLHIPKNKAYKLRNSQSYYHEYRSKDEHYVKAYYQQIGVQYADYRVGYWYISPLDLFLENGQNIMGPLYNEEVQQELLHEKGLFDIL